MNINLTLFGQMITFAVFIWFTMKYVWPPISQAMDEREKKIADGLSAAEQGQRDLELARHKSVEIMQEAKIEASHIVEQANQRATRIVEDSKGNARKEGRRLVESAQSEIEQEVMRARLSLQQQVAKLAVQMAEKIVQRDIDVNVHKKLLDDTVTEMQ